MFSYTSHFAQYTTFWNVCGINHDLGKQIKVTKATELNISQNFSHHPTVSHSIHLAPSKTFCYKLIVTLLRRSQLWPYWEGHGYKTYYWKGQTVKRVVNLKHFFGGKCDILDYNSKRKRLMTRDGRSCYLPWQLPGGGQWLCGCFLPPLTASNQYLSERQAIYSALNRHNLCWHVPEWLILPLPIVRGERVMHFLGIHAGLNNYIWPSKWLGTY